MDECLVCAGELPHDLSSIAPNDMGVVCLQVIRTICARGCRAPIGQRRSSVVVQVDYAKFVKALIHQFWYLVSTYIVTLSHFV